MAQHVLTLGVTKRPWFTPLLWTLALLALAHLISTDRAARWIARFGLKVEARKPD